jgi:transcriptional regulator with XRE-family HTH domain
VGNSRLLRALSDAGVTRQEIAQQTGVDPKTVERWITQGQRPYPRHRFMIARLLEVDASELWPDTEGSARPEVIDLFPDRAAAPRDLWLGLLKSTADSFDMLVYAGLFFHEQEPRLISILRDKADAGVKIRLMFGDPDADVVVRRGLEEGIGETVPAKVRNSLALYRPLAGHPGIDIRLHATTLYTSIYRFDDDMLVNPHIHGLLAAHAPLLHLRRMAPSPLFTKYADCFDRVWATAVPAWELRT